ncbi:MAG: hypothetical protein L6Q98_25245, partial [Anaerolineae bacterium]|nr:hypothetical protein [Anaerolineae bacterium]
FWIPLLAALPLALTALAQDFTPIDITEISPPITEAPDTPTPPPLLPTPPGMPETPVPEIGSTATLFAVSEDMIATLPPPQVVEPLADLRDAAEMHPAFYDDFSTFDPIEMRYAGRGFARVSYPGLGLALNLYERDQPVTVQTDVWLDVSAEARFLLEGGAARIFVRRSDAGHYSARVNAEGLIELFRGDQRLTWGQISAGEDRRLRLTALGDHLSVLVDGAVVLEYVDPSPLPSGSVALMAQDFRQNGALADEIGIWTTEPQAPPVPVFAAAPLSGTPTPVFLPAPQGLPDYTTLLLSQNEALYAGPQVGLYNQPLHFVDRSGVEQRLTLLPAIASGHIEIMYPDLAVSPDGDWGAVICGSSYEFIADVCVIGLTGDDAGKIKPMYGEMSGGVDAYSDSVPRWSSDASGGLWINFSSDRYGDTGRVRRLHFEPEAWRAMTVLPTTPPESLNLTLCTDVTTVDVWILCVNRDAAQPDVAAYRFNSSTGEKLPLLYTSQVSSSLRGLDAVVVPGGERLVAYVLYNGPCSTAPGCAVGWSRFSSDPAFTRLSGGNTSFQTAAHYLTPHLNPSGNRALVEQHVFGVNDQSVIFDLTVPNEPPKAVTIQHSNYLGVDWGKLHPCQIVATKSCSF